MNQHAPNHDDSSNREPSEDLKITADSAPSLQGQGLQGQDLQGQDATLPIVNRHPKLGRGVPTHGIEVQAGPVFLTTLADTPSFEDIQRITALEKYAWKKNTGIDIPDYQIVERIVGVGTRRPNPIILAREGSVDGRIVGAIWMSFCNTGGEIQRIPDKYAEAAASHDPDGDTVIDFSVFTDQQDKVVAGYKLLGKLANASLALAQLLGKDRLVAYSRAEFFLAHARWGDKFASYQIGNGRRRDIDAIFKDFQVKHPSPNFRDYIDYFGTNISNETLAAFRADRKRLMSQLQNVDIKLPHDVILKEYFALSPWLPGDMSKDMSLASDSFVEFARFHLNDIGDPFLMRAHQNLGAKIASVIVESRPEDIRGAGANVIMEYKVPEPQSKIVDLGGEWNQ